MKAALPSISASELCVLKQLAEANRYGLQLVDGSEGVLTRRAIYVQLQRMVDKKLIARAPRFDAPTGECGPTRQPYRITEFGRRALLAYQAWMKT